MACTGLLLAGPCTPSLAAQADVHLLVHTLDPSATDALAVSDRSAAGLGVRALGPGLAEVEVRTAETPGAAASRLATMPGVVSVTPDRRTALTGAAAPVRPADTSFRHEWDLWDASSSRRAGGYGVDAPRAWTRGLGSSSVVVAILDTGSTRHPDLAGATVLPGYDFVSESDGVVTGDGDGWDADPSDPGDACEDTGEPSSWHGTFVAGEIAAQHDGFGTAGAAPRVSIEPVRVLGSCGGTESDTVAAIEWASGGAVEGVPANERPARIISMSLGSAEGSCPAPLQTAIDDAIGRGALVIAAAGNDGGRVAAVSPANCRGVLTVAASTRSGTLARYSNRGSAAQSPTIAAPGGDDDDPVLGDGWSSTGAADEPGNRAQIIEAEGTSMAAPRVAAAAALLLSASPALTPLQVQQRLVTTATRFPASSGCLPLVCGPGIVDLGSAVGAPGRFLLAAPVVITGRARVGARLTAAGGRWRPLATTVAYRWLRDGVPVPHRTGRSMIVTRADLGHRITVRVTAVRGGMTTATAISGARRVAVARAP